MATVRHYIEPGTIILAIVKAPTVAQATFSSCARSSAESLKLKMSISSLKWSVDRVCVEKVAPLSTIHRKATSASSSEESRGAGLYS